MPAFLHKPARDDNLLQAWVASGHPEDRQLDFKADMWVDKLDKATGYLKVPAAEEFASDVAAFLNHVGGDLVLGITDNGGRAAGWFPAAQATFPGKVDQLRDWLNQRLEPRDACANVDYWESQVAGQHPVLVVSVAPYRFGPVAVLSRRSHGKGAKRTDRLYHLFPLRDGTSTRYLEMSEVARRMNAKSRSHFLGAVEALAFGPRPVRIASPVLVAGPGGRLPLHLAGDHPHAVLREASDDALVIGISCTDRAIKLLAQANLAELRRRGDAGDKQALKQLHQMKNRRPRAPGEAVSLQEIAEATNAERRLPVPLDLVRALWHEPRTGGLFVHVVLDVDLVWDGGYWLLASPNP